MENKCENCKYWGQMISKEFRRCLKSKMADSPMYSGCGLNTKKDFGCKLFEDKNEKKCVVRLLSNVKLLIKEDYLTNLKIII